MTAQSDTADLVDRLWESDAASALTNEAAREIEAQKSEILKLRSEIERLRHRLDMHFEQTMREVLRG